MFLILLSQSERLHSFYFSSTPASILLIICFIVSFLQSKLKILYFFPKSVTEHRLSLVFPKDYQNAQMKWFYVASMMFSTIFSDLMNSEALKLFWDKRKFSVLLSSHLLCQQIFLGGSTPYPFIRSSFPGWKICYSTIGFSISHTGSLIRESYDLAKKLFLRILWTVAPTVLTWHLNLPHQYFP